MVLMDSIGDNPADIKAVLRSFRVSSERMSQELREAINTGSAPQAREIAHKLKSGARSIGAGDLGRICQRIEDHGAANDLDQLRLQLPVFAAELARVARHVDSLLV
jgi:HPt (histidine-containing phosphotransfer) domain-containing protein